MTSHLPYPPHSCMKLLEPAPVTMQLYPHNKPKRFDILLIQGQYVETPTINECFARFEFKSCLNLNSKRFREK
ncbi:hypothetical protein MNBD_ALPHA07-95 [hydrothermal vent metagenome]|uniref:Uncharacterized protein n=1 Tax=hydrothermal vent metagenome TaxID=652676 RepID=A0A3B0R531_9ZZZZ